jgi:hypothetical protein
MYVRTAIEGNAIAVQSADRKFVANSFVKQAGDTNAPKEADFFISDVRENIEKNVQRAL